MSNLFIWFSIYIILGMLEEWAGKYIMLHCDFFFLYNFWQTKHSKLQNLSLDNLGTVLLQK